MNHDEQHSIHPSPSEQVDYSAINPQQQLGKSTVEIQLSELLFLNGKEIKSKHKLELTISQGQIKRSLVQQKMKHRLRGSWRGYLQEWSILGKSRLSTLLSA